MSWKTFFFIVLLILVGIYGSLKYEVMGDPNSHFNQTTRFTLGKYSIARTILGLHNYGDARAEYFSDSGPIIIDWFVPVTDNIDPSVLSQFASLVAKYTGRPAQVVFGGGVGTGTVPVSGFGSLKLSASQNPFKSLPLLVIFTDDYTPRGSMELSSTYQETAMVLSLSAHESFLQGYSTYLDNYLLSSMLHEFGNQIGLKEQTTDATCIMYLHAGLNGTPLEAYGQSTPQDFCPAEQEQIQALKAEYQ